MIETGPFAGLPAASAKVILADPPWLFKLYSKNGEGKSPQAHYPCMSIEDIRALPVKSLADPTGCVLIMWATSPMLDQQMEVLKHWGFKFKTQGQWVKLTKHGKLAFGPGYLYRSASEPWLVGTIGKPKPLVKNIRNVLLAQIREHSRKPDEMRRMIERQWDGPYVELFGRQAFKNWEVWGNQVGKFRAVDAAPATRQRQLDLLDAF